MRHSITGSSIRQNLCRDETCKEEEDAVEKRIGACADIREFDGNTDTHDEEQKTDDKND